MPDSLSCRAVLLVCVVSIPVYAEGQIRGFYAGAGVIADNDQTSSQLTDDVAASWALVVGRRRLSSDAVGNAVTSFTKYLLLFSPID